MGYEIRDGKLFVARTEEERAPIIQRLRKIEGQVRGLVQMVESDRYCLDEVQLSNAITAATREVALLVLSSHLDAGIDYAVKSGDPDEITKELTGVLRAALRL